MEQQELFQDLELQNERMARARVPVFPGRYFRMKVAYEDLIFSGLSLLLILLAGFCVGVERGKRLSNPGEGRPFHMASEQNRLPVVAAHPPVSKPVQAAAAAPAPLAARIQMAEASVSDGRPAAAKADRVYAIQLASYVGARAAEREARRLSDKGFQAEVLKQGRYFELRASGYPDRKEAANDLSKLKKWYHDAFIKKVSAR